MFGQVVLGLLLQRCHRLSASSEGRECVRGECPCSPLARIQQVCQREVTPPIGLSLREPLPNFSIRGGIRGSGVGAGRAVDSGPRLVEAKRHRLPVPHTLHAERQRQRVQAARIHHRNAGVELVKHTNNEVDGELLFCGPDGLQLVQGREVSLPQGLADAPVAGLPPRERLDVPQRQARVAAAAATRVAPGRGRELGPQRSEVKQRRHSSHLTHEALDTAVLDLASVVRERHILLERQQHLVPSLPPRSPPPIFEPDPLVRRQRVLLMGLQCRDRLEAEPARHHCFIERACVLLERLAPSVQDQERVAPAAAQLHRVQKEALLRALHAVGGHRRVVQDRHRPPRRRPSQRTHHGVYHPQRRGAVSLGA
mmetsp:Transcript_90941/g.259591  ORF Transcript_90941/g.259591 Transcript_90941/m.259591 type:complete len:368 (+) Transcript_90941:1139-2242(+)